MNIGAVPLSGVFDNVAALFMLRPISTLRAPPPPADDSDCKRRLTRREQQILALLAKGLDAQALANTLHISYVTARNHIQHIYEKLGIHSRAEAVCYVFHHGLMR